jgi:hypothetical protein
VIANVAPLDLSANSAAFGNSQVIVVLKIQPELCPQTKILSQANRSVCADDAVSTHAINAPVPIAGVYGPGAPFLAFFARSGVFDFRVTASGQPDAQSSEPAQSSAS